MSGQHTCISCGRIGTRGFHRIVMVHPKPDKWFCDNFARCSERTKALSKLEAVTKGDT